MNRRKGMIIMWLGIVIFVIAGIGIWRHHYLKIMDAEPINVYIDTPIDPDKLPKNTFAKKEKGDKSTPSQQDISPKNTSVETGNNIEMQPRETTQAIDNRITPKNTDNTGNQTVHHIFSDIVVENLPPKVVTALKDYEEVQLAMPELNTELKPLLEARSLDWDAIEVINDQKDVLKERRMNALEILSKYSKQAADKLQATIKRGKAAERVMEEYDEKPDISTEEIIRRMEELTK